MELTGKTAKYLVGRMFSFYLPQLSFAEYITIKSQQMNNVYTERKKLISDFILFGKDFRLERDIFRSDFKKHFEEYSLFEGYPEVIKTEDLETKKVLLKNIYETYVTKDIIELLRLSKVSKLRNIVKLLATRISSLLNFNDLCNDANLYFRELKNFLSILEETYIIYLLKPFYTNKTAELRKNPKLYFMDTGLRNFAIDNFKGIPLRTDGGNIIENAAFIQLHIDFPEIPLKYWRTLAKAEVDFILEREKDLVPIEIKYANLSVPKISRSYRSFLLKYKPQNALVLTQGFCGQMKVNSSRVKFVPIWYL